MPMPLGGENISILLAETSKVMCQFTKRLQLMDDFVPQTPWLSGVFRGHAAMAPLARQHKYLRFLALEVNF